MSTDTVIVSLQEKIDDLNQQAWEARVNDSPKAFQLSQESVNLARSINYSQGLAEGLRSLGFGYVRLFKNDEAAPLLRESLSLFQSLNDVKGQAVVYEYLGIIERNWGNLGASLELLLKGYGLIQQIGSAEIEGTSCYQIGVTYKHLGNHENALDYLYRSLTISKKSNNALMEAYAINIIGSIYFDNGDYNDALDCYQQGLVIRQESHDKWGEAGSLDNIGFTYLKLNDLEKATDYCKQSLKITQSTGDKKGEANTLLHLAEIFQQAGDILQASKFSNESLEIRKARGDRRGEAEVLLFLADLHKHPSDPDDTQVFEWLSGALKIADEIKAQDLLSKAHYNLHEYHTQKGNHKESLIQLEAHLQIEKELHKHTINQKISNLEISHKAEVISQRNKELIELNEKIEKANEELKIEASLERVRTVAMSMKKPDDLMSICEILYAEFQSLGFSELRNAMIDIYKDDKGSFLNYDFSGNVGSSIINFPIHNCHPVIEKFTIQIRKSSDAFAEIALTGKELESWKEFRKTNGELFDPKLEKSNALYYYFYSVGIDALGISTFKPVSARELDILKRFRNVFDLAYKRYTDIKQAEAQAKEAKIEAALERVRATSMAMHHSDDLITVINVVQEQLLGLGFRFHGANFVTDYNEKGYTMWLASPGESFPYKIYVPQIGQKYFEAVKEAIEKGRDFATYTLNFEEKNSYFKNLFENSLAKNTSEEGKRKVYESKGMAASVVLLDKVRLNLMNLDMIPFTDEENDILKRFGYVFEQSYTRFLDLQKAEAQARESQIQLAMERVRARTMAMQRSEELAEVATVLFQQVKALGVSQWVCGFGIWEIGDKEFTWYPGSPDGEILAPCKVPLTEHPVFISIDESRRRGDELFVYEKEGEFQADHYRYMMSLPCMRKLLQNMLDAGVSIPSFQIDHIANFSRGNLIFITYEHVPEMHDIFKRFAKVFDQTYTRFLDLQKAEAQAREAQIQLALERVRAKTMAMQKSDELRGVVAVLFTQLQQIGFDIKFCSIALIDKINSTVEFWLSGFSQEILPESYHVPNLDHPFYQNFQSTFRQGIPYKVFELAGEEKRSYDKLWFTLTDFKNLPEPVKKPMMEMDRVVLSCAFTKNGMIQIGGFEPLSETDALIIQRFAKVFEQTYTRFLDLQKAEAQAREAQIEVALERIRARAMAMHSSNELMDVANILREQMGLLDQPDLETSVVNLFEEDSELIFSWNASRVPGSSEKIISSTTSFLKNSSELTREMMSLYHSGEKEYTLEAAGLKLMEFLKVLIKANPQVADYIGNNPPEKVFYHFTTFTGGNLLTVSYQPPSEETKSLQRRAASVFDMAYRRYLDLKKAEAQAREAKIEAALERVRSRTMAMHKSDELAEVATVLFEQMSLLDNTPERFNIRIANEAEGVFEFWATDQEGHLVNKFFRAAFDKSPVVLQMYTSWKAKEKILIQDLHGDQLSEWVHYIKDVLGVPFNIKRLKEHRFLSSVFFSHGMIGITTNDTPNPATLQLIERFAKVFEQTYTRFLDLQKAEAQARDAQIETALERVRSKVMGMTNSNDLNETSLVFGEQLRKLGIDWQFSYFWLVDEAKNENVFWITWPDYKTSFTSYTLAEAEEYFNDCLISWRAGVKIHDNYVPPEGVKEWLDTFQRIADDAGGEAKNIMVPQTFANGVYYYDAMMKYGSFGICISKPATDEEKKIQCRFAIEFERAYTRFLDLKQAEAQAREARIEVALERVRAKAMAMHKSDDLRMAVATVFEELDKLNLGLIRCGIAILDMEKPRGDIWITIKSDQGNTIQVSGDEPMDIHPLLKGAYAGWLKQEDYSYVLQDDDLLTYYKAITKTNFQLPISATLDPEKKDQHQYYFNAVFQNGSLFAFLDTAFTDEAKTVMKRFANVFNLTYKRFLDLQKAEAQAREARIETALEKVRASTMAMQRSEDLSQTAFVLFNQFKELGEAPERIFIATFDDHDSGVIDIWGTDQGGNQLNKLFKLPVNEPTMVSKIVAAWKEKKRSVVIDLKGKELKTYLGFLKQAGIPVTEGVMTERRVQTAACFSNGVIGVTTSEPQSAEAVQLQERFAGVFDLTYTRFLDLQKAEEQAHKAQIETALERVRARALAMQQPEELKDVAHVLRTEMGLLGVEELETCSIYINGESAEKAECWYALKDIRSEEKKLVNDHFPLNLGETWVGREMLRFYQSPQKKISIVMQGENRKEWIRNCEEHSVPLRGYYGEVIPDRTYHLYKFSDGAIGAASAGDISEESWRMLSRAASVFTLAYSRFKDLTQARTDLIKLKEEKKRAEDALTELQATQKQLVQSEKMASLGELTAGIAHEIQNPLNFVNNFSDVSNELLEEMKTELEKGNTEEAKALAIDVKENLEKILHHGKRADAIVKGMLQHSRSSSGQKEPTDINTLAEEYLRLAYHGLRAKDKFFNAKFETELDPSINKINVVPQEIGRVILNLINNAFYAVTEKKKSLPPSPKGVPGKTFNDYEPIVTVTTKRLGPALGDRGSVEIRVADNGNGIPRKVLDKIFQPFFTTKPTGQGTGLGLSLSYDIITKGHDGEIKVETKEGEGSEFTITLPMN